LKAQKSTQVWLSWDLSSRIWGATLSPEHVINTLCTTINIAFVHIFT
jgi:hypothetical protein